MFLFFVKLFFFAWILANFLLVRRCNFGISDFTVLIGMKKLGTERPCEGAVKLW